MVENIEIKNIASGYRVSFRQERDDFPSWREAINFAERKQAKLNEGLDEQEIHVGLNDRSGGKLDRS